MLTLPIESRPAPWSCAVRTASALRVLVVEDDPLQRDLLCALLRSLGVRCLLTAADGWSALAHLAAQPCDLVISDLRLPGMDGIEFLHRATTFDVGAFAIVSAADAPITGTVGKALSDAGANVIGVLPKPLDPDAVGRLVQRCEELPRRPRRTPGTQAACFDAAALEDALAAGQFVPYYQPKIALAGDAVLGVELLARWHRPGVGVVPPAQFIGVMEGTPMIDRLTGDLFARALADAAAWQAGPLSLAINLSPHTLEDAGLPDRMLALAMHHGVAPERITFELTETAATQDPQLLRDCVTRLRLRGFRLSIDDFGTGYSSLALLLRLPFTELKIDRCFVAELTVSHKARIVVADMIALARRLHMDVVAEGIENDDELHQLRQLGCPAAQGYLFGAPMPQDAFLAWLARRAAGARFSPNP